MTFFLIDHVGADVEYGNLHSPEHAHEIEARERVEALWLRANQFLDADIREAAQNDLIGRYWEMYLAAAILDAGLPLVPNKKRNLAKGGPDFVVAPPSIYVEAIAARPGAGPDRVTEAELGVVRSVPKAEITLRLRAAIAEKHMKYQGYRKNGVLSSSDPYVVAINGARLPSSRGEPDVPWIIGAVFPIGNRVVHLDANTFEITGHSFEHEPTLIKQSGAEVSKSIFLDKSHDGISAVMYCWVDQYNRATQQGRDFILVHNPNASNPIERGALPCGVEAWFDGENVKLDRRDRGAGA